MRQGAAAQKLSRTEMRNFFRAEGEIRFDLSLCPDFSYPKDFDYDKYKAWFQLSGISSHLSVEDVLINIEAAEQVSGRLLFRNAGVLFFGKHVRKFIPDAYITCLLARGADKVHILDRKDFDGGIVTDIQDALRFVERNTRTAWRIEGLRREDIPEYPIKALREAITNAVMHRDWFFGGANVFIEIYSDRIEVVSPGDLPKGLALAELEHKSVRRNTLIADLLHRIGFIERLAPASNASVRTLELRAVLILSLRPAYSSSPPSGRTRRCRRVQINNAKRWAPTKLPTKLPTKSLGTFGYCAKSREK